MRTLIVLSALAFVSMGYSVDTAQKVAPKATSSQKLEIKDETDKTDVLAVPFDTSEVEEQQEEQQLENLQKYEQSKKQKEEQQKPVPAKTK